MTRRERLMATVRGEPVDRPAVSFYEIGGFKVDPSDPDPFNIYNSADWQPLLQLAEEKTDLIRMRPPRMIYQTEAKKIASETPLSNKAVLPALCAVDPESEHVSVESYIENGALFVRTRLRVAGRELTSLTRRDADVDTIWTIEHLLKDTEDLRTYLQVPDEIFARIPDVSGMIAEDDELGDRGIIMMDSYDPLCEVFQLFSMEDYTIIALTEQELFHAMLEKASRSIYAWVEKAAKDFPGRLWRICGAEAATEPYLPPYLFREYEVRYTKPMVDMIHKYGGYVRLHCHGRLKAVLPDIVNLGVDGIDPVKPPHRAIWNWRTSGANMAKTWCFLATWKHLISSIWSIRSSRR